MASNYYKGVIWTNHALNRATERGLTQEIAYQAFNTPDRVLAGSESGTSQYQKRFKNSLITVVAKQNEKYEWIILSCWIDPPLTGSEDEKRQKQYKNYKNSSNWGKVWITIKRQLGLAKF